MLEFTIGENNFEFICPGIKWENDEEPDWEIEYTY